MLTDKQKQDFEQDGYLVLRQFYNKSMEIEPIQKALYEIIACLCDYEALDIENIPFRDDAFDHMLYEMLKHNKKYSAIVYDAAKQISCFIQLLSSDKNKKLYQQLAQTDLSGIIDKGYGIRMDYPGDVAYKAPWHQEYPVQGKSLDAVTLWTPLVDMSDQLGPVELCCGSHHQGVLPVVKQGKTAYELMLEDEGEIIKKYEKVKPILKVGDLLLLNFLTVHRSSLNVSSKIRWSMQMRYFNFKEKIGLENNWRVPIEFSKVLEY